MQLQTITSEDLRTSEFPSSRNLINSTIQGITGLRYNPYKCPVNLIEAMDHRVRL
jgi:hypothetical protein